MRDFQTAGRSTVFAQNGMCATSHPLAAQVAIETLKSGGNAMDAAIAGAVLLGICEPQMTGIGGDCFVLFKPAGQEQVRAFNGSGWAPRQANAERLRQDGVKRIERDQPEAVTIPGAVDAFCTLSDKWGKLGLERLLAPAIHYSEQGVPVAPRVAFDWQRGVHGLGSQAKRFYTRNGEALKTGDVFRSPNQAEVLRRIARDGREGFYTGEIAEDMLSCLQDLGGVHSAEDFSDFNGFETTPVDGHFPAFDLIEHPPNGQGATAILMLNILSHFDLSSLPALSAQRIHIESEASKLAYDARNRFIADPDCAVTEKMLSKEIASELAQRIDPKRAMNDVIKLTEDVHKDTVYLTVVDKDRMAVSLIYSIFDSFGSGIASEKFGILLQNRGCGFNLLQGHPNEYGARKRPMHTIIPGMVRENGRVTMPFGVMGGQYQPLGHVRLLRSHFQDGLDLQSAMNLPRSFPDQGVLRLESGISDAVAAELSELGHKIERTPTPLGGAQAIYMHQSGVLEGASDPRKDGIALGY